jgi:LacI family transcriptional regulator
MPQNPRRVAVMLELEWPYKRHSGIFAGTQKYAQEHGWRSVIDEYAGDTLPAKPVKSPPYDGVIARATKVLAQRAAKSNVPVVNVWYSSPVFDQLPGVFADFAVIGRMRAEHLLSRGLRRFATLTSTSEHAHRTELAAFREKLDQAGFSCDSARIPLHVSSTLNQWRKTEKTIAALIEQWKPPIGVYVGMEMHGRLVAQVCQQRGWRVPEDVAIITGWNEETYCEHLRPTLTSVEVGYERIGYEAARLLDRRMDAKEDPKASKKTAAPEHILLPPEGLLVRESTDFVAVDDPLISAALEFIAANCHLKIGQNDVADAVGMETRTLQRRFRKYLARPIAKQILHARLERAKREITQTKRSLTEISREVGFGPRERMYEVFLRELGVTPSRYRKERQIKTSSRD